LGVNVVFGIAQVDDIGQVLQVLLHVFVQIRFCDNVEKQVSVAEESIRVFPLIRLYDPIGDAIHQILRFLALIHEDELIDQFEGVEIVLRHHTLALEHQMEPWRWV
jgi:hypothetical protein